MEKFKGLALGIGSLPHKEAKEAVDLVLKSLPRVPFWPQLPRKDKREGMVAQFSENLPCLRFTAEGVKFDPASKDKELEDFYAKIIDGDTEYFRISPAYASGLYELCQRLEKGTAGIDFIKCHVTGPFTFAASINDEEGKSLLHDKVFMEVIIKGLAAKALWQIKLFRKFGKKIILFFDEPYLSAFGSAYTSLNREDVIKGFSDLISGFKSEDVLTGAHCCGNTDWSIFTDTPGLDIINFDAFDFQDKFVLYAPNLKGFLEKGGAVCWGVVPTEGFSDKITPESLVNKVKSGIDVLEKKGVSRKLLLERLLVSPSCGLGSLDIGKAGKIFKLLNETSALLQKIT
ncbi:MAG: methionine synthase [Candidatus Omnitrophica bacterium]|nr:methionine synthase [Candidatus Omnitrophota bacterium]